MESIYEKPKEVLESEVIQKESILPQNEQKQLRERDQQQKQVTKDASEVDVEVCESFENYQADLPESDTTSDITSDTTSDTTNGITSET